MAGNTVNVAGPAGGGGIILKPEKPSAECPACAGGDCTPDNFQAMWFYESVDSPNGVLSTANLEYGLDDSPWPGNFRSPVDMLIGMVIDPTVTTIGGNGVTQTCCNTVDWDVTVSASVSYMLVNGLFIVTVVDGSGGTIAATPTVCGTTLNTLNYFNEGV